MKQPKILLETQPEMIRHLRADSNYTILFLTDGKRIISGYSLKVFESIFDEKTFVRIDRSNLVNKAFIICAFSKEKDNYFLLENKTEIIIPRRRKTILIQQYPNLFNL